MNTKFLKIGIVAALLLMLLVPPSIPAQHTQKDTNQLVQQPAGGPLGSRYIINITISFNMSGHKIVILIQYGVGTHGNATNINVEGVSTAFRGKAFGKSTVNTTIPSMAPGETVRIDAPTQMGLAIMQYNVNVQYNYNGTIEHSTYGPDKYLLFLRAPIDLKG
jgi:hypothetical protein